SEKQVFWLHGIAGTGELTSQTQSLGVLPKSDVWGRALNSIATSTVGMIPPFLFGSIAYRLASFSSTLKVHILAAVKAHGNTTQFSPREQLQKYVIAPMNQLAFSGPIIIVLNAQDECGSERGRQDILGAMYDEMTNFPRFVRVFLVSRYEVDI
ncbi:hypothetical protein BV22DRAFT_991329, partial [Leucogyrophana mollusca]